MLLIGVLSEGLSFTNRIPQDIIERIIRKGI